MTFIIDACQINSDPGDLDGNLTKILNYYKNSKADLVVFPELSLTGYHCKDLFLDENFLTTVAKKLEILQAAIKQNHLLIGMPRLKNGKVYNSALLLHQGDILLEYDKYHLPNYGVFDEKRYFTPGSKHSIEFKLQNKLFRLLICEDLWHQPKEELQAVDFTIVINASPFSCNKHQARVANYKPWMATKFALYLNALGGQDHLVFDGGSFILQNDKQFLVAPQFWKEQVIQLELEENNLKSIKDSLSQEELLYQAIMLGLYDYVRLNGFSKVLLGLSGGIDSALVATIALDVFGPEKVLALSMPSEYSTQDSINDALLLVENLNCQMLEISIQQLKIEYIEILKETLRLEQLSSLTEENIQPRIRAILLMALANEYQALVLSTSNKSESAVGYTTIYGDMIGAFAPIVDLYKSQVYKLAIWRNNNIPQKYNNQFFICEKLNLIPENIINKEPSAELKFNQKDSDTLPPYAVLDNILQFLIEKKHCNSSSIDDKLLLEIDYLLHKSEFKRHQMPLGPKLSDRMLSFERRYPISIPNIYYGQ
jgi:NAD+ synthetase